MKRNAMQRNAPRTKKDKWGPGVILEPKPMEGRTAFWREAKLNEADADLLTAVWRAHRNSAVRYVEGTKDSAPILPCSSAAVVNAWAGSRDYAKAIAAGLMTLGEVHGCVVQAYAFLLYVCGDARDRVNHRLERGAKIPGFGNAFVKGQEDPNWAPVREILAACFPNQWGALDNTMLALWAEGKKIWPNPAGYTAAAALALDMPKEVAPWLFVQGRLESWTKLIVNAR